MSDTPKGGFWAWLTKPKNTTGAPNKPAKPPKQPRPKKP